MLLYFLYVFILFEAASESIKSSKSNFSSDSISILENQLQELTIESEKLMAVLVEHKKKVLEVNQFKSNLETYLNSTCHLDQSQLDAYKL